MDGNKKNINYLKERIRNKKVVAYIPLDDRPCNLDRIIYAAQAMGIELLMPDKDIIKTNLDFQPVNSTGLQIGYPNLVKDWVKNVSESRNIDAYLISLDQVNSGGLVGSRSLNQDSNHIGIEMNRAKEILDIINGKPAYFFDTVMRLATTVGYEGMTIEEYEKFRSYGSEPRKQYRANSSTTSNQVYNSILNNYSIDESGNQISPARYGLTDIQVNRYLETRKRKFRLNVEIGNEILARSNTYLVYGVDDSSLEKTIQQNEINYLTNHVVGPGKVFAGADEVAICLLSKIASDMYCSMNRPKVKVTYFGDGENEIPDGFDYHTLRYNVETHITISGGVLVNDNYDLEVLVLTIPKNGKSLEQNANDLHWHANYNNNNNILTSIIDASTNDNQNAHLQRRILGYYGNTIKITKLLSYSNWNTVGNTVGMAVGHAIGRCAFLKLGYITTISRTALEGQVKLLFNEYVKDICYWIGAKWQIEKYLQTYVDFEDSVKLTPYQKSELCNNFYKYGVKQDGPSWDWKINCLLWASFYYMTNGDFNIHNIASLFYTNGDVYETYLAPNDCKITQINWVNYPYENGDSAWFNLIYPWHRTFECNFPINVSFK